MKITPISLLALILLVSFPAAAGVLYTTYLPGYSYDTAASYAVYGPTNSFGDSEDAMPFTVASTSTLSSVDVSVMYGGSGADSFVISLVTDNSDSPGSTVLEDWTFTAPLSTSPAVTSLVSLATPTLTGGTQYWLIASGNTDALGQWDVVSTDPSFFGVTRAFSSDAGADWSVIPGYPMAFDILGGSSTVPEPGTWGMLLVGGGLLCKWLMGHR
jgi:hypothetical protein